MSTSATTPMTRPQPMEDLPAFRNQAKDTYESTYTFYHRSHSVHPTMATGVCSKAPDHTKVDFAPVERVETKASSRKWRSTSNSTYGHHTLTPSLMRAQAEIDSVMIDSSALEGELETAAPLVDIPTTAYFHGPMPDRAIKQHFLTKKTTSAVIDGSGKDQVLEVGSESAEPGFYYLRDADGSRKTLEIRDPNEMPPVAAHSSVGGMPMPYAESTAAVPFSGLTTTYKKKFSDPQVAIDMLDHSAQQVAQSRMERTSQGMTYGEQKRITVPKVFKHEMGFATTERKVEMRMKYMVRDPNPPRASHCTANKLIYSSASDQLMSG